MSDGRAYVVVVGAGPTGLYLAGDLAEAGIPVTVLERRSDKTSNLARAFAVHARTMESFDMRGLIDELLSDAACRVERITWFDAATGDFSRRQPGPRGDRSARGTQRDTRRDGSRCVSHGWREG